MANDIKSGVGKRGRFAREALFSVIKSGWEHHIVRILGVQLHPLPNLPHSVQTFGLLTTSQYSAQNWQQDGGENGNDRHHRQQFNDGESAAGGTATED